MIQLDLFCEQVLHDGLTETTLEPRGHHTALVGHEITGAPARRTNFMFEKERGAPTFLPFVSRVSTGLTR